MVVLINNDYFLWTTANNLEQRFQFGAAVPYGSTFLLVGGGGGTYRDTVHKYILSSDEWELMSDRLGTARETPAAMLVHLDMFPSCTGDADEMGHGGAKNSNKYNPDLDPTQSNAQDGWIKN